MYVDGYILFAIYLISVVALAISIYTLWSLNDIRENYKKSNNKIIKPRVTLPPTKVVRSKGYWD